MHIREASESDFDAIWPIFKSIVPTGDTYAYDVNSTKEDGFKVWMAYPRKTFIVEDDGEVLATYYLVTNQRGPGSHVCNCGYMVSVNARGRGLATSMCEHSQKMAKALGYKAMQFNFVASSNIGAIRLWEKLGFDKVGVLPKAFSHPSSGFIDAFLMYKWLV